MKIYISPSNKIWFYSVKKNDENLKIKDFINKFNISEDDFFSLNNNIESLYVGDVILIPASQQYFHIVGPLESYESIANLFNCTKEKLMEINKTKNIFIGQKIYIWFFFIICYN